MAHGRWVRILLPLGLLLLGFAQVVIAQKTDVIALQNGDRVTGEILSYSVGKLKVDSVGVGTISVNWEKILSITSDKQFEVETTGSVYWYGTIQPSTPPGKLVVVSASGTEEIAFLDIVRFSPIYASFWKRLDGSLNLGFNYDQASSIVQLTLNADATARKPTFATTSSLSLFYNKQQGVNSTQRANLSFGYEKFLKDRWLLAGALAFDRNLDLGVDWRVSLGAGVGREVIQTNQALLRVGVGLSGEREYPTEGPPNSNLAAIVTASYGYFMYGFPKFRFGASLQVLPYLTEAGRVRLQFNTQVKREIISDFALTLSIFDSYDSRDPVTGTAKNDWGPVFTVGWTF
jgi:hypothetical protein